MKRILEIVMAAALVFGVAGNASALMNMDDFAVMAVGGSQETTASFGASMPGTTVTIEDAFSYTDFSGASSWADIEVGSFGRQFEDGNLVYGGVEYTEYVQANRYETLYFAATGDVTILESGFNGSSAAYEYAADYHGVGDAMKDNGASNSIRFAMSPMSNFQNIVTSANASATLDNIMTEDLVMTVYGLTFDDGWNTLGTPQEAGTIVYSYDGGSGAVDITYNPVPVPAAVWLLGSGLMALVGIRRRKV